MKYIIYMDVFFMVNLIMDTLLLKLAACYIKPQTTFIRCLAGGCMGSILSCLSMILSYENMVIHMLFSYIFVATVMVFVTYGKATLRQMTKRVGILYLITIIIGGAMNLVYNYTYFGYVLQGIFSSFFINPLNFMLLLIFTSVSYIILNILLKLFKNRNAHTHYVEVQLELKGKSIKLKGLIDSGNSLKEPYYGKPVHVVEYEALQMILEGVDIHREKYRLVPFHSLGRRNGLVEVIECDKLLIWHTDDTDDEDEKYIEKNIYKKKVIYVEKNPAIGLYHSTLSSEKKYEVLLNQIVGVHSNQM